MGNQYASGDDFNLADRSTTLFGLIAGEQAQARQESYRKRPVTLPREVSAEEERADGKKAIAEKPAEK